MAVQGYTQLYRAIYSYTELNTAIQGYTHLYRAIHNYTGIYAAIQNYVHLNRAMHTYNFCRLWIEIALLLIILLLHLTQGSVFHHDEYKNAIKWIFLKFIEFLFRNRLLIPLKCSSDCRKPAELNEKCYSILSC